MFIRKKIPHKRIVLHVGMPKCGTSTVQKTLQANRPLLKRYGVDYLDYGASDFPDTRHISTGNANALVYAMFGSQEPHLTMEAVTARLRELIDESPAHTIVLSHEDFVVFGPVHLSSLRDALTPAVREFVPVIHIREHASWMSSDYQQHIKQLRASHPISKHVGRRLHVVNFSAQCRKFQDVFGSVICRLISPGMNIAHDFTRLIGAEVPELRYAKQTDSNTGLSAEAVEALVEANRAKVKGEEYKTIFRRALETSVGKPKFTLPDDLRDVVREYAKPDIEALRQYLTEPEWVSLARTA